MSKAIETGSFVHCEAHPEYGVGRVIAMESFSMRVLFSEGGLRLFRAGDMGRLRWTSAPSSDVVELLTSREGELAAGTFERRTPKTPPVEEPPKKRAPRKKAAAKRA